jgi:hypothetical protein
VHEGLVTKRYTAMTITSDFSELEKLAFNFITTPQALRRVNRQALCNAAGCTKNRSFLLQNEGRLPSAIKVEGSHPHYYQWELHLIEAAQIAGYQLDEITQCICAIRKQIPTLMAEMLKGVA